MVPGGRDLQPGRIERFGAWLGRGLATLAELRRWRGFLGVALVGLALSAAVLVESARLLRGMHLSGRPAGSVSDLTAPFRPVQAPDHVAEVVSSWRDFALSAPDVVSPSTLARVALAVESLVFVPSYLVLFSVLLVRSRHGLRAAVRDGMVRRRRSRPAPEDSGDGGDDDVDAAAQAVSTSLARSLDFSFLALVGLALADLVENAFLAVVIGDYWNAPSALSPHVVRLLWLVSWAKRVAAVWVLAQVVLTLLRFLDQRVYEVLATVRLVRVQLLLVVLFAAGLLQTGLQMPDALLVWDFRRFVLVLGLTVLLALVLWAYARRLLRYRELVAAHAAGEAPVRPESGVLGDAGRHRAVAVTFVGAGVLVALALRGRTVVPLIPIAMGLGVAVPSWLMRGWVPPPTRARPVRPFAPDVLPRALAAAVVVVLGVAVVRHSVAAFLIARHPGELGRMAWGVAAAVSGLGLYAVLRRVDQSVGEAEAGARFRWWGGRLRIVTLVVAPVVAAAYAAAVVFPFTVPPAFSAVGVAVLFLTAAALFGGLVAVFEEWHADSSSLPPALRILRLRRLPLFTMVLIWGVVAGSINDGTHFDVRRRPRPPGTAVTVTLEEAFHRWVEARESVLDNSGMPPDQAIPMVLVAAEGGGIRAATWTAVVLDCLLLAGRDHCPAPPPGPEPSSSLFIASGISGGSLGLVEYLGFTTRAQRRAGPTWNDDVARDADWVERALGDDYLAPVVSWGLLVEIPRSFLDFGVMDRAEVLERSWERSWPSPSPLSEGFLDTQASAPLPHLILNGASVRDGCWMNASLLDLGVEESRTVERERGGDQEMVPVVGGCLSRLPFAAAAGDTVTGTAPGTADLVDFLCADEDVNLSTAALLSARFPLVTPSGRVSACPDRAGVKYIVDGGYIEGSGAEALMGLWPRLEELVAEYNATSGNRCVVPFFVQIDNGYQDDAGAPAFDPPNQVLVPVIGSQSPSRAARADRARAAAGLEFTRPLEGRRTVTAASGPVTDRYARLIPVAHLGVQAPLGWVLADGSKADLRRQVGQGANVTETATVRSWVSGDLRCTGG